MIVFAISGKVDREEVPSLCGRLRALLESNPGDAIICDVGMLSQVDATMVNALARLQLTARRSGRRLWVRHASRDLADLLELMGLSDVVPLESALAFQLQGQSEEREEPCGIEEEADPGDPTV